MLNALFDSTSIPVMEQVVNFTQARQNVLAGNIANLDTPGYKVRDLSVEDFQARLAQAIQRRRGGAGSGSGGLGYSSATAEYLGSLWSSGSSAYSTASSSDYAVGPSVRSPGETAPDNPRPSVAKVSDDPKNLLHHDKSNVGVEYQVTEMVKNHIQHNMALAVMTSQFRLLQAAISERA
ncbi:MAG: flagellar basal body rod protein FlgB [Pirellulales bacterium]|nr:flagellar basal body rod protein FlgB [Pirellulales bacterium]